MGILRSKALRVAAALVACAGMVGLASVPGASADPGGNSTIPYAGVGSDTTQDVMNALAKQVKSTAGSGSKQIVSFDAVPPGPGFVQCIGTKQGAPLIDRANGSTNGKFALADAKTGGAAGAWVANPSGCQAGVTKLIGAGNLDFARSSSGPSGTGTQGTWVPFARDALTYVWETNSPTAAADGVGTLTNLELKGAYDVGGSVTKGATKVFVCLPNPGSGTRSFWISAVGTTEGAAAASTIIVDSQCGGASPLLEEHNGDAFHTMATRILAANPNSAVVVPFSVSQYVAQCNGFGVDRSATFRAALATTARIGDPDGVAGPTGPLTSATAPCASNATYYTTGIDGAVGTYGRDVYNILWTASITGLFPDNGLLDIFSSATNPDGICGAAAQTTIQNYGFKAPKLACGNLTRTGTLTTGHP